MNSTKSHKIILRIIGLALLAILGTYALAVAQTENETSTSTPEVVAVPLAEAPATSTPEAPTPVLEETSTTTQDSITIAPTEAAPATIQETTPKISVGLDCRESYVGNLYDTPSSHLEEGYFENAVPATTTGQIARKIGTQAWTTCYDEAGIPHEFTLTAQEYADLAKPNAGKPQKSILVPVQ